MTWCKECSGEYPQDLEHCPHCAVIKLEAEAKHDVKVLRCAVIAVEIMVFAFILVAGQLAYAAQRTTVTSPPGNSGVSVAAVPSSESNADRWTPVNGEVLLVLTLPKSEMGGGAKAYQEARGLAVTVFDCVPAASSVAVFDGNTSLIGRYHR